MKPKSNYLEPPYARRPVLAEDFSRLIRKVERTRFRKAGPHRTTRTLN